MAGNIKGITIEINGDTTKLDKALSNVESSTKSVNTELRQVNGLLKFNPGNTDLIAQKQELLAKQVQNTSQKLDTLKQAQAQVEAQFASGDLGEDKYRAFQRELIATEGKLASYKGQLNEAKNAQSGYETSTQRLQTLLKATGGSIDDYRDALGNRLVNAIKEGKASSEQLNQAFQKIAQEAGVAKGDLGQLANALDKFDGTPEGLKATTKELDNLSQKSESSGSAFANFKDKLSLGAIAGAGAQAMSTLTGGIGDLIHQSTEASDAIDKFKGTMKFAGIGDAEIEKVTKAVKKYADDTVYDLQTVSNTTAQLASNGVKNYEQLTEAAGNLNAVAGGNQDTFKSVAMVLTQTAGAGKLTTENWNQLADAIPGASGPLQEAMKKNGAYTGNFREAMEKGQISADEFNQAVTQLGMNDGAKKAATSTSTFEGAIGSLQANIVNGIQQIIEAIGKANMTKLISDISNGVVGALKILVEVLKFVAEHADVFKTIAVGVTAAVAAFKAFSIVSSIVTAVSAFATAVKGGAGAMEALNLAMNANPIGLIITAITAVVAALVYFFTQTETGRQLWSQFVDWLKQAWESIKEVAQTVWEAVSNAVKNAVNGVQEVWGGITEFFSNLWTGIVNVATTAWQGFTTLIAPVVDALKELFGTLGEFFTNLWNGIVEVATTVWNNLAAVLGPIWDSIVNIAQTIWNGLSTFFSTLWDGVSAYFQTVWNAITAFLTPVWDGIVSAAKTIWDGIKDYFSGLWDAVKAVFEAAWDIIKTVVETAIGVVAGIIKTITDAIKGDWSAVWEDIKGIIQTVWDGIKSVVGTAINAVKDVITSVWNGVKDLTSSIWDGIKSVVSGVWDGLKAAASTVFNAIKSTVSDVWNSIKSVTSDIWNGVKSTIDNVWSGIKSGVSDAINTVKSTISDVWNGIKSTTESVWNGIKEAISGPINGAKDLVRDVIDRIKSFFDFKITWPHIPLPHFTASGSANPLDWIKGEGIPSIGIDWYAKGGILTKPTVFSGNGNNLSVGGEAGPEGVIPLNKDTLAAIGQGIADASDSSTATTINLTVYGSLDTATARKWANVLAVELQRAQKRGNLGGV
ncbi:MAG: tape measure protein [Lactobacillus sp.]|jgi:tape measure domain-containing protein|nr:tape measure protein [Lactobacillus sp.]